MASSAAAESATTSLVLKREFDAAPERVFDAWLDPKQIARWIGPRGVNATAEILEARVGGRYRIMMHMDSGATPIVGGRFREIVRPERLVFTWAWEGEHPNGVGGHETIVTLTFKKVGEKTEMTLRHDNFESQSARDSHSYGWSGSFDKLAEALTGAAR